MALHKDFPQSPHAIFDPGIPGLPGAPAEAECSPKRVGNVFDFPGLLG